MNGAVIYKIINLTNGKFYIGSTTDTKNRFRKHKRLLNSNTHHCPHLQAAWNKYGESNFIFKVVELITDATRLAALEQEWLDEFHGTAQCYNYARFTDNSNRGIKLQDAHRNAISEALKRRYKEHKHPALGRKHTEESKKLMSLNRSNKPVSDETKQKLREANLGKQASEATRQLLSQQRKGKIRSVDHASKYNKQIIEVTSGNVYSSLKVVKETFGMSPGMLAKALASNKPLSKGKNKGLWFRYL